MTYICKIYTCKIYTCKIYTCKIYTCKIYTCKIYTCKIYTCKIYTCKIYTCNFTLVNYITLVSGPKYCPRTSLRRPPTEKLPICGNGKIANQPSLPMGRTYLPRWLVDHIGFGPGLAHWALGRVFWILGVPSLILRQF